LNSFVFGQTDSCENQPQEHQKLCGQLFIQGKEKIKSLLIVLIKKSINCNKKCQFFLKFKDIEVFVSPHRMGVL